MMRIEDPYFCKWFRLIKFSKPTKNSLVSALVILNGWLKYFLFLILFKKKKGISLKKETLLGIWS